MTTEHLQQTQETHCVAERGPYSIDSHRQCGHSCGIEILYKPAHHSKWHFHVQVIPKVLSVAAGIHLLYEGSGASYGTPCKQISFFLTWVTNSLISCDLVGFRESLAQFHVLNQLGMNEETTFFQWRIELQ